MEKSLWALPERIGLHKLYSTFPNNIIPITYRFGLHGSVGAASLNFQYMDTVCIEKSYVYMGHQFLCACWRTNMYVAVN